MHEPSVLSARWRQYVRPVGQPRERCICGLPECQVVLDDELGGVPIQDGRLVFIQAEGLVTYSCWQHLHAYGRAGALRMEPVTAQSTPARPHSPGAPGFFSRLLRKILWR